MRLSAIEFTRLASTAQWVYNTRLNFFERTFALYLGNVKTGVYIMTHSCRLSVAPMLDWTDRHCRYFHRLMTKETLLYTEMVTTGAIIHGKGDFLAYNEEEHPLALQLGGSNAADLATCAKLAQERGYDEINLNVGCPSDRVQNGRFGACLMAELSWLRTVLRR